jgi:hypothetical protein
LSKNSQVSKAAIYFVSVGILLVAACPYIARAQSTNASLSGVVKDSSGGVIPGAELVLTAQLTNTEQHFTTGKDGIYRFANLQAGSYTLSASAKGFERFLQQGIVLALSKISCQVLITPRDLEVLSQ